MELNNKTTYMIKDISGDLLTTTKCNIIIHQANLYHTFGAGIARFIREKFPEAYEADCRTENGSIAKLGSYSVGPITQAQETSIQYVINMYSQVGLGGQDRQTSYDHMVTALEGIKAKLGARHKMGLKVCVGIPFQIGCGLANGNWKIVRCIIETIFADAPYDVCIYTRPEDVK